MVNAWRAMRTAILTVCLLAALAGSANAHPGTPFQDGTKSARGIASSINRGAAWDEVSCRYRKPHVLCNGILKTEPRTDVWYRFTMTVHKTGPKRGYAMTCVTVWATCRRQEMRFGV